jgi:hypothetical protein
LLSQEVDKEFAASKHFRFHHTGHELLIVDLLFLQLLSRKLLFLVDLRQRRNDDLRIFSNQIVSQLHEIYVQALHLPAERIGSHHDHERLPSDHLANLRRDQLINTAIFK